MFNILGLNCVDTPNSYTPKITNIKPTISAIFLKIIQNCDEIRTSTIIRTSTMFWSNLSYRKLLPTFILFFILLLL